MKEESEKGLENLIRDELINYIIAELRNGYDLDAIKNVLQKKHHESIISSAINYLKKKDFDLNPLDERKENVPLRVLKENPDFTRILEDLKRYIVYKLDEGYSQSQIKEALLRYGHYYDLVEHSLNTIKTKKVLLSETKLKEKLIKEQEKNKLLKNYNKYKFIFSRNNIYLFIVILMICIVSYITASPIFVVIYSFLPIFLINFLLRYRNNLIYAKDFLVIILLVGMFYTINYTYEPFGMNINSIMIYNTVFFVVHFLVSNVKIVKHVKKKQSKEDNKKEEDKDKIKSDESKEDVKIK